MNQTLSDLATRCKTLLGETPGPEGRAKVAAMLSDILADPAKVDALVPPSTGERDLLYQDPDLGFCILAHVYNEGDLHAPRRDGPTALLRIEGTDMSKVKRLRYEAV